MFCKRFVRCFFILFLSLGGIGNAHAQAARFMKQQIAVLAGPNMDGRGYVKKGQEKAARYLQRKYAEYGLLSFRDSGYLQPFFMDVNTFPGAMQLQLGKKEWRPGAEYLVAAQSSSFHSEKLKIKSKDLSRLADTLAFRRWAGKLTLHHSYVLTNTDSFLKKTGWSKRTFYKNLPATLFIIPQKNRLVWTVAQDTIAATIVQVPDTLLGRAPKKGIAHIDQKWHKAMRLHNVIGYVLGTQYPDSFIVFTSHFDHLGMMGRQAEFAGASDNASGTSAMLYLAQYFTQNPQPYSIAFMAFGAEEAGLVGSRHYVKHPLFPLDNIKWLTNLDIMGSAEDGISVVNGKVLPEAFRLLDAINTEKGYLPKIIAGAEAANSDHHYFHQAGVPAIFIFTQGGPGHYHDIYDKPKTLPLTNLDQVIQLIIDFTQRIQL